VRDLHYRVQRRPKHVDPAYRRTVLAMAKALEDAGYARIEPGRRACDLLQLQHSSVTVIVRAVADRVDMLMS